MRKMYSKNQVADIAKKAVSGGTQWYHHKLNKRDNTSIEFVFPFEKSLLELINGYVSNNGKVFGALLAVNGPTIGNLNPNYTFSVFYVGYDKSIVCYSVKGDGTLAETKIKITDYSNDVVTKYKIG